MKTRIFLLAVTLATVAPGQDRGTHVPPADSNAADASLIVVHADVPLYPALAVAARQSGTVRVRLSVKGGAVVSADAEESAPPVLVHAAKENARTWRFAPDVTSTLDVTYVYDLAKDETGVRENPRIEMQLPSLVRITARPVKAIPMDGK